MSNMKKDLSKEQRTALVMTLSKSCNINGKPRYGAIAVAGFEFDVHRTTVWRIWNEAQRQILENKTLDMKSNKGNFGRKRLVLDREKIMGIELRKRSTIRRFAKDMNVSKYVLARRVQEGFIRRLSNTLKPLLTEENKKTRLNFCLSMIADGSNPMFINMHNHIHIDEKWFYLSRESNRYYLMPEELEPHRTCKSKHFITKVMFLTAVGRPRTDPATGLVFSGKVGCFPFIFNEPTKRTSNNRIAGTLEMKVINSVTQDVYRTFLIEKLLPAIKQKWPHAATTGRILIQQDNVKPHISVDDFEFNEASRREGVDVKLIFQPPNSPDMNVLDLGFFRAIQSLQQQQYMTTIDELLDAVEKAFDELSAESLNNIFLSLQLCMVEVMKKKGGNNYTIPHINNGRLAMADNLPEQIRVDPELIEEVMAFLAE